MILKYLEKPVRYDLLDKWLSRSSIKILDIGCGNHSASITKRYYPKSKYYGLDINKNFNNDKCDFNSMEEFYEKDLDSDLNSLKVIPDNFFDHIILSHIIEHLNNGEKVLINLFPKLKQGGCIYIETPCSFTAKFPNFKIGLNFFRDPSHVKVYEINDLLNVLKSNGFFIIKYEKRRAFKRICFLPIYFIGSILRNKRISPAVFWDLLGWSYYIIARKN